MKRFNFAVLSIVVLLASTAQAQKTFTNLDSLISYASLKSTTLQSGEIRLDQAKKAKLAAVLGIADLTVNNSYSYTDNTKLPTSLFPADAFGGEPGTYKEVQTGIQYNSSLTNYNEIKLLNFSGWQNFKLAKVNIDLTESNNLISRKSLNENIASIYYNIVNLQEQLKATIENLAAVDTLQQIAQNKYQQGLVRLQDVNESKASFLNTKESINQIEYLLQQQYLSLKILTDIPESDSILISQKVSLTNSNLAPEIELNDLIFKSSKLNEKIALTSYQQLKLSMMPTVSLFNSNSTQQYNSSSSFPYNSGSKWYANNYIGIKLSISLPSANLISQTSKARFDHQLAKQNTIHSQNKAQLEQKQLGIDYHKAISQWTTNTEVFGLKKESYLKNINLYSEGILSLDQALNSYNAMVSSNYNRISSAINVLLTQSKIEINNKIK